MPDIRFRYDAASGYLIFMCSAGWNVEGHLQT